jgi:proteasome beta subunit
MILSDTMFKEDDIKKLKTGTTTIGLLAKDAVILGAERKATMGYLVASKNTKKILKIDEHIAMSIAGVVGDAQAIDRYIKAELKLFKLHENRRPTVKAASHLMANMLYGRRFYPYIVQLIVGGYDKDGPALFSLEPDGSIIEEKEYFSSGSGSPMAFGVLEDKFRPNMPAEEAKQLVARAISAAVRRDIASGGSGIDITVIDAKGFHELSDEDVQKLLK